MNIWIIGKMSRSLVHLRCPKITVIGLQKWGRLHDGDRSDDIEQ